MPVSVLCVCAGCAGAVGVGDHQAEQSKCDRSEALGFAFWSHLLPGWMESFLSLFLVFRFCNHPSIRPFIHHPSSVVTKLLLCVLLRCGNRVVDKMPHPYVAGVHAFVGRSDNSKSSHRHEVTG